VNAARIVSLLPSATEIVCALGAANELVGVSHECDFPDAIRGRPVLTRSRVDPHGSSRAIDEAVRAVVRDALSIYAIDEAALAALQPDLIVTQDLCEVCAVSLDDVRAAVARLAHRDDIRIVSLRPTRLDDVWGDVERVADALGLAAVGRAVAASLRARLGQLGASAGQAVTRPRVVSIEWVEPIMIGGTWMPELIEVAGGIAVGASPGAPAPTVDGRALADLAPDVVVIKPCGFTLERALEEGEALERLLESAPGARAYVADGNAFFNRPGPRLVESAEIMAACVHPDLFAELAQKHAAAYHRLR
jgi:iron complex transport system substrate-binding protein